MVLSSPWGAFLLCFVMAYATATDMLSRYDANRIGDLVQDLQKRVPPATLIGPPAYATLQTALEDAAALIDAHCLVGGKYHLQDLLNLVSIAGNPPVATPTNQTGNLLIRINCDLAFGLLLERRGYNAGEIQTLAPGMGMALELLKRLGDGELIFNVAAVILAGTGQNIDNPLALSDRVTLITSNSRIFGTLSDGRSPLP